MEFLAREGAVLQDVFEPVVAAAKLAARLLRGSARRQYQARMTRQHCRRRPRRAETVLIRRSEELPKWSLVISPAAPSG